MRVDAQTGANEHKSEFVYDGLSRKRITREYDWADGAWQQQGETRFVYSGRNVIQERDGNNNVTATYTRGQGMGGGIGGLLARSTAEGHFYYHYDGRGNVTQLTDATQATVARYDYDAFGNTSATGPQSGQPYRFSTKEQHAYSGVYDYGFRFYSPGLGRWINRDPLEEEGGMNLYGFVFNDPVNQWDHYGLASASWGPEGSGSAEECASLLRRIGNLEHKIQQRLGELQENPQGLPERAPGDVCKPSSSRWGHRKLINVDKAQRDALKAEYAWKCSSKLPPMPYPVPVLPPVPVVPPAYRPIVIVSPGYSGGGGGTGGCVTGRMPNPWGNCYGD